MTDSECATMTSWKHSIKPFYLGCMVSEKTWFYCKPDTTPLWFLRLGALQTIVYDGFWMSNDDYLMAFNRNVLSRMPGFRDNMVLLQAVYDVIVIYPPRGASGNFHDSFWKMGHHILIAFSSNVLSVSEITRFYSQQDKPDMTSSWFLQHGAL